MISLQGVQMVTKIIDNKNNGKVIDELKESLEKSSKIDYTFFLTCASIF